MYESAPLFLSPANTGLFEGSHRITLHYRNQWAVVTVPYVTMGASADMKFNFRKRANMLWGAGIALYKDEAGDSKFGTTNFQFSVAPTFPLNKSKTSIMTAGLAVSFTQRNLNYSALTFDSQYSGFGFDPNAYNNETFETNSLFYPDMALGLNYRIQHSRRQVYNFGFSVHHLLNPQQSFNNDENIKLDTRFVVNFNAQRQFAESFDICPVLLYEQQGTFSELIFGGLLKLITSPSPDDFMAVNAGCYFRWGDMAAVGAGIDYHYTTLNFSYDFNYSNLTPASLGQGGVEISLIHRFSNYKFSRKKTVSCPVF